MIGFVVYRVSDSKIVSLFDYEYHQRAIKLAAGMTAEDPDNEYKVGGEEWCRSNVKRAKKNYNKDCV